MSEIQQMIHQETQSLLGQTLRRYGKVITSLCVGIPLFVLLFYSISEGFTQPGDRIEGFIFGLLSLCGILGFVWMLYWRMASRPLGNNVQENLNQLLSRLQRNRWIERLFIVGWTAAIFFLPRFISSKGMSGITNADVLLALAIGITAVGVILFLNERRYSQEMNRLEQYVAQLNEEQS